eukprot:jgi/Mesen1/9003/ME000056S08406
MLRLEELESLFSLLCRGGGGRRDAQMDSTKLTKFFRESGLLDKRSLRASDVDLIVARIVKSTGQRKLRFEDFAWALQLAADRRGQGYQSLINQVLDSRANTLAKKPPPTAVVPYSGPFDERGQEPELEPEPLEQGYVMTGSSQADAAASSSPPLSGPKGLHPPDVESAAAPSKVQYKETQGQAQAQAPQQQQQQEEQQHQEQAKVEEEEEREEDVQQLSSPKESRHLHLHQQAAATSPPASTEQPAPAGAEAAAVARAAAARGGGGTGEGDAHPTPSPLVRLRAASSASSSSSSEERPPVVLFKSPILLPINQMLMMTSPPLSRRPPVPSSSSSSSASASTTTSAAAAKPKPAGTTVELSAAGVRRSLAFSEAHPAQGELKHSPNQQQHHPRKQAAPGGRRERILEVEVRDSRASLSSRVTPLPSSCSSCSGRSGYLDFETDSLCSTSSRELHRAPTLLHAVFLASCSSPSPSPSKVQQEKLAAGGLQRQQQHMDSRHFLKLCRDCGLLTSSFSSTNVDIIFNSVKARGERKLSFAEFRAGLERIAHAKRVAAPALEHHVVLACTPLLARTAAAAEAAQKEKATGERAWQNVAARHGHHTSSLDSAGKVTTLAELVGRKGSSIALLNRRSRLHALQHPVGSCGWEFTVVNSGDVMSAHVPRWMVASGSLSSPAIGFHVIG